MFKGIIHYGSHALLLCSPDGRLLLYSANGNSVQCWGLGMCNAPFFERMLLCVLWVAKMTARTPVWLGIIRLTTQITMKRCCTWTRSLKFSMTMNIFI